MFMQNPYKLLSEAATQDLMDPATSKEVKDVVDELEDDLTNNVEEVKPDDMVTNGGVPVTTAESALLVESNGRYYVSMEAVMAIAEDEASVDGEEAEPEAVADKAEDVIEQIADANGVDKDDITVVINGESAAFMMESAINESKATKGKGKKAVRKAKVLTGITKALKGKVKLFKKTKKSRK